MSLCASLLLPTSSSASSVSFDGYRLYVTDGIGKWVYVYESNGLFIDRYHTVRAYGSVSFSEGRFVAADSSASDRIYILNGRFEEIGSIRLESQSESRKSSSVIDASYSPGGNSFDITHPTAIREYALDGSYIKTVTNNPYGREFVLYRRTENHTALLYRESERYYITVDRVGGTLPPGVIPKSFIAYADDFYGAFTVGGFYNYVIPVYENGGLNDSIFGNFAFTVNNISRECCNHS